MENFKDIVTLTKNKVNYIDDDPQIDLIIKEAINHFYMNDLSKICKNVTTTKVMPRNGLAELPEDCLSVIEINPPLNPSDYIIDNSNFIKTSLTERLEITYNAIREPLILDDDVPQVNKKYWYPMALYGCYAYFMHRKKETEAAAYNNFLARELEAINDSHSIPQTIRDNYSFISGGDLY